MATRRFPGTRTPDADCLCRPPTMASAQLAHERPGHTLQPTALVNEVYLRLADTSDPVWQNRSHFMASAGKMMRWILVDHAREKHAIKRGGGQVAVESEKISPRI